MSATTPYKTTPVFDQTTLPKRIRHEHKTEKGVWGIIRILEGSLRLHLLNPTSATILDPKHSGLVLPEQLHFVEVLEPVRMQVEFYYQLPDVSRQQ